MPDQTQQQVDDAMSSPSSKNDSGRLILISNRLPITIKRSATGDYTFAASSGGLVSGISGLIKTKPFLWYGWPGIQIPKDEVQLVEQRLHDEHSAVPVFVPDKLADRHYNGFSNEIMWALLHYHTGEITFDESAWAAYVSVNRLFADRISRDLQEDDLVWIHDYHLMLLPGMIRERAEARNVNVKIGWFLHTPWPTSEVYQVLPVRNQVLEGLLQSDLIGFHTYDYTKHFLSTCNRLLPASTTPNSVIFENRKIATGAFPIGIDPDKFINGLQEQNAKDRMAYFQREFGNVKLIIGCDRLDYIKGVPHKLHAFRRFLEEHPEMVGKVKLIQIAIPSREDVEEYQVLRSQVNELVGQINGRYGDMSFNPVHLKHTSVSPDDLMALFAISDVCFVASTRDGMNLVAYEYVACQAERHGVLVLSEFAGCAQSFASGSVVCNPWDIDDMSASLYKAITMSEADKVRLHANLFQKVTKYTSSWWGQSFISELIRVTEDNKPPERLGVRRSTLSSKTKAQLEGANAPKRPKSTLHPPRVTFDLDVRHEKDD